MCQIFLVAFQQAVSLCDLQEGSCQRAEMGRDIASCLPRHAVCSGEPCKLWTSVPAAFPLQTIGKPPAEAVQDCLPPLSYHTFKLSWGQWQERLAGEVACGQHSYDVFILTTEQQNQSWGRNLMTESKNRLIVVRLCACVLKVLLIWMVFSEPSQRTYLENVFSLFSWSLLLLRSSQLIL